MKKFLIFLVVVMLATCLVAGCTSEVKTYADSGQTINIKVNQEFIIAIGSNPTTGYSWSAGYDDTMLGLTAKIYKPAGEAEHQIVGEGGVEYFHFEALKKGETEITMTYKREWEEKGIDQKVFVVNIN